MMKNDRDEFGLRPITLETRFLKHPAGSCFVRSGDTWVLCTASVEEKVPPFMERQGRGWVTAEYSMLPASTHTRSIRASTTGKTNGRTHEIQRLIGRALRAAIDPTKLGERTIIVDCDVLQADGGTRTASINGGFVALALAAQWLQRKGLISASPLKSAVAAVSVGLKNGKVIVDLDYQQDSSCDVDMNFVMLEDLKFVEIQGTAERTPFSPEENQLMLSAAQQAAKHVLNLQRKAILEAASVQANS